jgi:hypothetical protein
MYGLLGQVAQFVGSDRHIECGERLGTLEFAVLAELGFTSFSDPLDTDRGGRRCRTIFLNYHKIPRGRHSLRDFCVNLQYEEKKNT